MPNLRCLLSARINLLTIVLLAVFSQGVIGQSASDPVEDVVQEARELLAVNNPEGAADFLQHVDSLDAEGYFLLGRAFQQLSQHDRAVDAFVHADSSSARHLMSWAQSLKQLGLYREAEGRYERAFEEEGAYRAGFEWGRLLIRRESWPQAQRVLERVRDLVPDHPEVIHQLGYAYLEGRRLAPAIHHLHQARRLSPDNVRVVLRLTEAQIEVDSLDSAMRVIFGALENQPESPELWVRKGIIDTYIAGSRSASEAYNRAISLGDSTASTLQRAGIAYFEIGEYKQASDALRETLHKDETMGSAAFYLGLALKEEGKTEEARLMLEEAAELSGRPVLASIFEQLADVYMLDDAFQEAISANQVALKLDPQRVAVQFHLATVYDTYYEDRDPAMRAYQSFLDQVGEDDYPEMQEYARSRLQELAAEQFFQD